MTCDHKLGFVSSPDVFSACSLVEKERLLSELMRSQKEFESMKHSFEHKLQARVIAAVVDLTARDVCATGDAECNRPHNVGARPRSG